MAAVTTLTIRKKHRTRFRTTMNSLECECPLFPICHWAAHIQTLGCEGGSRNRGLIALRQGPPGSCVSAVRLKNFDHRLQGTSYESARTGMWGTWIFFLSLNVLWFDGSVSIRVTIANCPSSRKFPALPPLSADDFFSRATGLSTLRRSGQLVNLCVYFISRVPFSLVLMKAMDGCSPFLPAPCDRSDSIW